MKTLGKSAYALIVCMIINSIGSLFVNTFLIAQILHLTNYSLKTISLFYIITYTILGIFSIIGFALSKKVSQLLCLRLGALCKAIFILLIVLLGDSIIDYYIYLGIFYGLTEAIYWCGGNPLKNTIVESDKLKYFISIISIAGKVVSIGIPIILGICIDKLSFKYIAIIIFALVVIQFITTLLIKPALKPKSNFSYKKYLQLFKENPNKNLIKLSNLNILLRGFVYFLPTLITFMVFLTYKNNTSLGMLETIASFVGVIILTLFNISKKIDKNIFIYLLFAILPSIALILSIIYMQPIFVIIFQMLYNASALTLEALCEEKRGRLIRKAGLEDYLFESLGINEIILNLGRIVGFFGLFLIGLLNNSVITIIITTIFAILLAIYSISVGQLEIKLKKQNDTITK